MMKSQGKLLFANEQFRMTRLQVFNWGTFSGVHEVPISECGFLFVGRSGSGKSTLLDAFSALLVPPRWIDFNAAAREADRTGRDRNLMTYIRGAWGARQDGESGEIATRYLRTGSTWSALALSYRNAAGHFVTLVQVFWIRGNGNGSTDVKRHYFIFDRSFDLREMEDFGKSNFDIRKLKHAFQDAFARDEFRPYCERFCRLLGIENEMALRLLHKTQSAKNLGDLNTFLRDFMLDKPETFEVADRLVNEFGELNAAHQAVVTARQQVDTLASAREQYRERESLLGDQSALEQLQAGVDSYREQRRAGLLKERIASLEVQIDGAINEVKRKQELLDGQKATLHDLEQRHRELGGDQIEQWEREKSELGKRRQERSGKRSQVETACEKLAWPMPKSPKAFAETVGAARQEVESWQQGNDVAQQEHGRLSIELDKAGTKFQQSVAEVEALKRQPSNIPAVMLELRRSIALAIGISEGELPFAGELIEVKPDEAPWQGVIERVMHGFALSVLVEERHYAALAGYINGTDLHNRLVYYRTARLESRETKPVGVNSLVLKLNIKEGSWAQWLHAELRERFNYACADSLQAFRNAERAATMEGQVKHNKTRHEKNDRARVDDRRNWVLGFDNREKREIYQKQAQELADTVARCQREIAELKEKSQNRAGRALQCQALINIQWQEIDLAPVLERIAAIEKQIKETREGNVALQEIAQQISDQTSQVTKAEKALREATLNRDKINEQTQAFANQLKALEDAPSMVSLTPHQVQGLDERFAQLDILATLENLDKLTTSVVRGLGKELQEVNEKISECAKNVETRFADFKRQWPMDAGDMDATLASAADFFAKLARLETDGLPAYEQRFFDLLQNQSHQNLAALSTYLNDARKSILERMDLVNRSLSQVAFNQTAGQYTYLHIEASDRQLPEVREFKQGIQQSLSYAWSDDRELAESRFVALRRLVERLASQDTAQRNWRDAVLDVRQHVEFIGREIDEAGVEVEIYRSGSGKSGGQRQKLATTCLAAALRYQLGGSDHGVPMYAPVVLDEAFDKADNEFTELSMNIFVNFGFQMIVATPLKAVMTLEPFIGGACFVDIADRRISSVLLIEYDTDARKLKLPEKTHEEASVETSR
ncbi:MAG: ATP-binding protein [Chthoniobacteraceae bacterium]